VRALERRIHCPGGDRGFAHSGDLDDVRGHLPVLRNTPQLTSQVPKLISLFPMKLAIYPFQCQPATPVDTDRSIGGLSVAAISDVFTTQRAARIIAERKPPMEFVRPARA